MANTPLAQRALDVMCDTPTDKAVLSHLAVRANGKGYCWPKMITLAKAVGVTRRTIISSIQRLQNRGWIKVRRGKYHNFYDVTLGSHLTNPRCEARITSDVKPGSPPIERSGKDQCKGSNKLDPYKRAGKDMKYSRGQSKTVKEILERIDNERVRNLADLFQTFEGTPVKWEKIVEFWRRGCHMMFDDMQQAYLPKKQAEFMRAILKHLKLVKRDPYDRFFAILSDWTGFVAYANDMDGTTNKPKMPNLGFMAGHMTAVINYSPATSDDDDDEYILKHAKH